MTFATAGVTKLTLKSDGLLVPRGIEGAAELQMLHQHLVMVLRCLLRLLQVGQIQAYDRDNSQWNDFIIKGQTIQIYAKQFRKTSYRQ